MADNTGAWNIRPGDGFVPHGRRPFGPYGYTSGAAPRELGGPSPTGTGRFWVRLPGGRKSVVTKVENPTGKAGRLQVSVNGKSAAPADVPAGQTVLARAPIPEGATELEVGYTGDKGLVLLETSFE
jgi:hypothetical protein